MSIHKNYIEEMRNILSEEELNDFIESCKIPLGKSIKINMHKISAQELIDITTPYWWHIKDTWFINDQEKNDAFYIDRDNTDTALWRTFLHQSWFFYIQEVAASMPPKFLDIKENDLVLDLSAAPWGKSCQIWDYLLCKNINKPWMVISNDVDKLRLSSLAHNLNRMWIFNSAVTNFNWFSFWKNLWEVFDHVLVDAPCSWEWTWFKSDAALKFWKIEEINKIAWTQFQLLVSAIKSTKPWGTIVYSTCTLNPYENEYNLKKVMEFFGDSLELEEVQINNKSLWLSKFWDENILTEKQAATIARFWPHIQKTWWFFVSKLRKKDSTWKESKLNNLSPKNPFKIDLGSWSQKKINSFLEEVYWMNLKNKWIIFVSTDKQVYAVSEKFMEVKDIMQFEKIWVPILKLDRIWYIPLHGLWVVLWNYATKNYANLSWDEAQTYAFWGNLEWKEIVKFDPKNPYIILKWNNQWMWIWKYIEGYIKNKYIKI